MNFAPVEQSFRFLHGWAFWLLLLLPLVVFLRGRRGTNEPAVQFSSLHILEGLGRSVRPRPGGPAPPWMLLAILALGILALARPQHVRKYRMIKESGIEMILAIDVSRSMQAKDMRVAGVEANRLQAARSVIQEFVRRRPMDRIGLVAFAGRPYLACPLTLDHEWLEGSLARVRVGLVEDGTAIGSAIAASSRRLDRREARSKVVVLLTDGANNAGKLAPVTAAQLAGKLGVKIYAIAVGTPGSHTIPVNGGTMTLDQEFDFETLENVAAASGGEAFLAKDTPNLEQIFAYIDSLETTEREARVRSEPTEFFSPILVFMTVLAMARLVAQQTVFRRYP